MAAIGNTDIEEAFRLACLAMQGVITEPSAIDKLVTERRMNRASAGIYVRTLRWMLTGEGYTRTLNQTATAYYLDGILCNFGAAAAWKALSSLYAHLEYYQLHSGSGQPGIYSIAQAFEISLNDSNKITKSFSELVDEAMLLSEKERWSNLPQKGWKPTKIEVKSTIFMRNRYVSAEVLHRADGKCEACLKLAPFMKFSNGAPYLEVHHRTPLAAGGDDTVENAIALCPNCHRKAHYG